MFLKKRNKSKIKIILPTDVVVEIFRHFHEYEILIFSQVCKEWYKASRSDILWKKACSINWIDQNNFGISYFSFYKLLYTTKPRPCFLYNSSRTSCYTGIAPKYPLKVSWDYQARKSSNVETFIVHRSDLFFIEKESLKCLNIDTGKINWENSIPPSIYDQLEYSILSHSLIYLSQKSLMALSKKGDIFWEKKLVLNFNPISFAIKGTVIILCLSDTSNYNIIHGIDIFTGNIIWELKEKNYTFSSRIIACFGNKMALVVKQDQKSQYICILEFKSYFQKPKIEIIKTPLENLKIQEMIFQGNNIIINYVNTENIFVGNICKLDLVKKMFVPFNIKKRFRLEWCLSPKDNILWIMYENEYKFFEIEGIDIIKMESLYKFDYDSFLIKVEDKERFGKRSTQNPDFSEVSNIIYSNECIYTLNYKKNGFELMCFNFDKKDQKVRPNYYALIKEDNTIESFYHSPYLSIHEGKVLVIFKNQILIASPKNE